MFIWSDDFQHVWWKRGGKITQVWPQSKQKVPYFHRKQKECPEINADFIKHADVICLLTINENLKVIISTLYHVALSMKIYSQWLTPLSDYLLESKCRECPLPKAFQAQVPSKFEETWDPEVYGSFTVCKRCPRIATNLRRWEFQETLKTPLTINLQFYCGTILKW